MAFLSFIREGVELGRRPLAGPVVIGRATDCDVSVHDILLSRHHCRLQPADGGWVVIDLNSRNGTRFRGERIDRRLLRDGDELMVGKTAVRFHQNTAVTSEPASLPGSQPLGRRPADPFEALAGTVTDFDAGVTAPLRLSPPKRILPRPQPKPPDPEGYERDDVYAMLTDIASSSWDSIYANASRPRRPLPRRAAVMPTAPRPLAAGRPGEVETSIPSPPAGLLRRTVAAGAWPFKAVWKWVAAA